ncbi:hypothetical protein [Trinickia dabaoshanensis]|uniref:hypothetical protein n=1 Tax=Trinickia dabaoshanensis TaxID=564714 RepID=UPI001E54E39A|nr:hypothetical protein [Trinickia dabaoshanensis]
MHLAAPTVHRSNAARRGSARATAGVAGRRRAAPAPLRPAIAALLLLSVSLAACGRADSEANRDTAAPAGPGEASAASGALLTPGQLSCTAHAAVPPDSREQDHALADGIDADIVSRDGTRLVALGEPFKVTLAARTSKADTIEWQIRDAWNVVRSAGRLPIDAGNASASLDCTSSRAGYFAVMASLVHGGQRLARRGTRPAGIATFGVLPDVSSALPPVSYAHEDQHRFGGQGANYLRAGQRCCDGDGYRPLYPALGLSWANDTRNWYIEEPAHPDTFKPGPATLAPYFRQGDIMRLIQLDGIPGWASPTGAATHSYAPLSEAAYASYLSRVGADSARIRAAYFPTQQHNYYQVTWEPDYDGGLPWLDTDAHFVDLYRVSYEAIHAADPHAVVMGPTNASVRENVRWLARLAPLHIGRYLDGLTIHGYYDAGTSPSHPPERLATEPDPAVAANALPASLRDLRAWMTRTLSPGAKLFATETGISYDIGAQYGNDFPTQNVLFAQGAVVARTHLILLGEGVDMTYVFYSSDIPESPPGYGLFFDLEHARGAYGARDISPKPAAMAVCAMTRLIDGTTTLGHLNDVPAGVYGYAFQRLNGGKVVTALWTHENAHWNATSGFSATYSVPYTLQVDAAGTSGQVTVFDAMGNAARLPYRQGRVALTLTESPIYVVSTNLSAIKAHVTAPAGYAGQ